MVQEYVETSGGIPGLVDGRHDLRIGLYNGEVIHGRLRTPPEGGYIANIGYGGTHYVLDIASLPADAKALAQAVDSTFSKYSHRFISVDFALTDKGWKVFELNCWPGLVDCKAGKAEQEYMNTLAQRLIMSAKEYTT